MTKGNDQEVCCVPFVQTLLMTPLSSPSSITSKDASAFCPMVSCECIHIKLWVDKSVSTDTKLERCYRLTEGHLLKLGRALLTSSLISHVHVELWVEKHSFVPAWQLYEPRRYRYSGMEMELTRNNAFACRQNFTGFCVV